MVECFWEMFGVLCWVLGLGSWVLGLGSGLLALGSWALHLGSCQKGYGEIAPAKMGAANSKIEKICRPE